MCRAAVPAYVPRARTPPPHRAFSPKYGSAPTYLYGAHVCRLGRRASYAHIIGGSSRRGGGAHCIHVPVCFSSRLGSTRWCMARPPPSPARHRRRRPSPRRSRTYIYRFLFCLPPRTRAAVVCSSRAITTVSVARTRFSAVVPGCFRERRVEKRPGISFSDPATTRPENDDSPRDRRREST